MFPDSKEDEDNNSDSGAVSAAANNDLIFNKDIYIQLSCLFQMLSYKRVKRNHLFTQWLVKQCIEKHEAAKVQHHSTVLELKHATKRFGRAEICLSHMLYQVHQAMSQSNIISAMKGLKMAAFDSSDYNDQSSLPGTSSRHYTASVINQEVIGTQNPKPPVPSTDIRKSDRPLKDILSFQEVSKYFIPVIRPTLPADMLLDENSDNFLIHNRAEKALT